MTDRTPPPAPPRINPQFEARLDPILATLLETRALIAAPLERARVAAAELQDYVNFEIGKLELVCLGDNPPPAAAAALNRLKALRDEHPAAGMNASIDAINTLYDALWIYAKDPLEGSYRAGEEDADEPEPRGKRGARSRLGGLWKS